MRLRRVLMGDPPLYPDWTSVLERDSHRWRSAIEGSRGGPRVLIATNCGGHIPSAHVETALAVALTLRGADVELLLCDGFLPACQMCEIGLFPDAASFADDGPLGTLCGQCFDPAEPVYRGLGLPLRTLGGLVGETEREHARRVAESLPISDIGHFEEHGVAIGEHAVAGALRFYARGDFEGCESSHTVLRRFFEAALLTASATRHLLRGGRFDVACFNHGIYVPQGLVGDVARHEGVRVVNWNPAYRTGCFIFSHGDTYHHTLLEESVSEWQDIEWSPAKEQETLDYLESRRAGTRDWIWFHEKPEERIDEIQRSLGFDLSRPTVGLLTNVIWDAQLHYRANAFPTMMDWVLVTIEYFSRRPELQLVIRVHPAEIRGTVPSRQRVAEEIEISFPTLPPNIVVIEPECPVSTYAVMERCNAVLIFGTKTGVELTARGIPVIVGGEAWIRNKGLTMDASSPEEYERLLDDLPLSAGLNAETRTRARKYAYHFFFRRMIPIQSMTPTGAWPPYRVRVGSLDELSAGMDPGLDVICDGVLEGSPFVYDPQPPDAGESEHRHPR
jgi:hypothetical protein